MAAPHVSESWPDVRGRRRGGGKGEEGREGGEWAGPLELNSGPGSKAAAPRAGGALLRAPARCIDVGIDLLSMTPKSVITRPSGSVLAAQGPTPTIGPPSNRSSDREGEPGMRDPWEGPYPLSGASGGPIGRASRYAEQLITARTCGGVLRVE